MTSSLRRADAPEPPGGGASKEAPSYRMSNFILTALLLAAPTYLFVTLPSERNDSTVGSLSLRQFILAQIGISIVAFIGVVRMVGIMAEFCHRKGQTGKDLCKKGTPAGDIPIPESQGLSPGVIYLVVIIICQLIYARDPESLTNYNSSLLSICFMLFLGFIDDVLDLPWRYKLVLPPIASLPLLCSYNGSTAVLVPRPFRPLLWSGGHLTWLSHVLNMLVTVDSVAEGKIIELGWFFMLYMALLAVFCTNAINIYAGINGLEAGQALVIAVGILSFQLLDLQLHEVPFNVERSHQLFSITLVLPFIAVVLGLLYYNFYPARVFVGDTFCYFAGMTFAVMGIHGHFSKTLVFFFIPQIINFLLSCPQLFKVIPCPRHRLPRFDAEIGKLRPSICPCRPEQYKLYKAIYGVPANEEYFINFTLINVVLRVAGPLHERTLCIILLVLQAVCSAAALFIRFYLVHVFV